VRCWRRISHAQDPRHCSERHSVSSGLEVRRCRPNGRGWMREERKTPLCVQCGTLALIFLEIIDFAKLCHTSQPHHAVTCKQRFRGVVQIAPSMTCARRCGRSFIASGTFHDGNPPIDLDYANRVILP
jgi:hypothetical protein